MPIYCSRRPSLHPEPQQTKYQHWKCVDNVHWKCNTVRLWSLPSYTILWFKNLVCYAVCFRTLSGLEQTLLVLHITETICDCDISIYAFFVNYYLYVQVTVSMLCPINDNHIWRESHIFDRIMEHIFVQYYLSNE